MKSQSFSHVIKQSEFFCAFNWLNTLVILSKDLSDFLEQRRIILFWWWWGGVVFPQYGHGNKKLSRAYEQSIDRPIENISVAPWIV